MNEKMMWTNKDEENGYFIEREFEYRDHKCVVTFNKRGHRCGYVSISEDNFFFGKDHNYEISRDKIPEDIQNRERKNQISGISLLIFLFKGGKVIDISGLLDVHGGITYSEMNTNDINYPVESDGNMYYGFDCAHLGDRPDFDHPFTDQEQRKYHVSFPGDDESVKSMEYCVNQCMLLVDQIEEFNGVLHEQRDKKLRKENASDDDAPKRAD